MSNKFKLLVIKVNEVNTLSVWFSVVGIHNEILEKRENLSEPIYKNYSIYELNHDKNKNKFCAFRLSVSYIGNFINEMTYGGNYICFPNSHRQIAEQVLVRAKFNLLIKHLIIWKEEVTWGYEEYPGKQESGLILI